MHTGINMYLVCELSIAKVWWNMVYPEQAEDGGREGNRLKTNQHNRCIWDGEEGGGSTINSEA